MALTVENGTGLAAAESFISEADADTYLTEHADPATWTGANTAEKEAALRYATEWLDGKYEWDGTIKVTTQALGWPRTSAYDNESRLAASTSVPGRVERATCEVALSHLSDALNATQARGGAVRREKVGSLEVEYEPGAAAEVQLPHISRILNGLGSLKGSVIRMVRA